MATNMEYNEDLEVCLREVQDEFQKLKFSMVDKFKVFEETMNRLMKAVKKPNRPAKRVVETATNLEVFTKSQRLMTFPSKQPTTSPPKRRGAQTLPIRRHHRISRARKWHRYGRKRKTTRTKKKMKKVSRAERREKRRGKKPMTTLLTCRQGLLPSEATWKDAQAFLRTLRTRFFGRWSNDENITGVNQYLMRYYLRRR